LISPIIIHLRTSADGIPPLFITKRRRGTPPLVSGIFQAARIAPRVRPEAYITPDRYFTIVRRASPRQSERAQSGPRGGAKTSLSRRGIPLANGARCRGDDAAPRRLSTPLHAIYSYRKADESSLVAATCFAARSTEPSGTLLAAPLLLPRRLLLVPTRRKFLHRRKTGGEQPRLYCRRSRARSDRSERAITWSRDETRSRVPVARAHARARARAHAGRQAGTLSECGACDAGCCSPRMASRTVISPESRPREDWSPLRHRVLSRPSPPGTGSRLYFTCQWYMWH